MLGRDQGHVCRKKNSLTLGSTAEALPCSWLPEDSAAQQALWGPGLSPTFPALEGTLWCLDVV